jgi:hypothetical protein
MLSSSAPRARQGHAEGRHLDSKKDYAFERQL